MGRYEDYVQEDPDADRHAGRPAGRRRKGGDRPGNAHRTGVQADRVDCAIRSQLRAGGDEGHSAKTYKRLQLAEFLKAQGVTDDTRVDRQSALFAQLEALVGSLQAGAVEGVPALSHVGDAMAPYLAKAWRDAEFEFRGRVLRGQSTPPARWQQVLDAINTAAGPMLGHEYAARYLPAATQGARRADRRRTCATRWAARVDRSPWMSAVAKAEAKAKLDKLKIEIGTPRRDLDYTRAADGPRQLRRQHADRLDLAPSRRNEAHRSRQRRSSLGRAAAAAHAGLRHRAEPPDRHRRDVAGAGARHERGHRVAVRFVSARWSAMELEPRASTTRAASSMPKDTVRDWWTPAENDAWNALGQRVTAQYGGSTIRR